MYLHKTEAEAKAQIARGYDASFRPSEEYRDSMPDIMDSVELMNGAPVPIEQVGVSNFRLPLKYRRLDGSEIELETSVLGTVSLEASLKGINMSRIMRSFYEHKDDAFTLDTIKKVLDKFRKKVESLDAPKDGENWFVMVNAPINEGQDWNELRARTRANVLLKLNKILGVSIEDLIEEEDYTDPVLMESNYSGKQGSIYGNSSNSRMAAFYRHPNFSSKLKGLYFAGVTVHPGGGIPLALNSAKIIFKK